MIDGVGKRALKELSSGDPHLGNTYAVIADPSNPGGLGFARWMAEGAGRETVIALLASGKLRGFSVWPVESPGRSPGDSPHR